MSEIKYAVFPGWVTSRHDWDRHFIGFGRLCRLWGVSPAECLHVRDHDPLPLRSTEGLIHLHPRYDGDYSLENLKARLEADNG